MSVNATEFHTSSLTVHDNEGHVVELRLGSDTGNLAAGGVQLEVLHDSVVVAVPIRLHLTDGGGRLWADFPGCDSQFIVVDDNGKITAG